MILPTTLQPEVPEPFAVDAQGELMEPERLASDWIELALLTLMVVVGLPLNVIALIRLLKSWRRNRNSARTRQEATRTSFLWLKIHLTVIDLIVILVYCPSHVGWLMTYSWEGGHFMCLFIQYAWDFCFHLVSFGVVSIAIDRLCTVYRLMHMGTSAGNAIGRRSNQLQFVRRLIISCYVLAAIFSLPQWFVYSTVESANFSQCTTIWHKERALEFASSHNFTTSYEGERLYTLVHLMTVFWIPFLILFCAYFYIVIYLFFYSIRPYSSTNGTPILIRTGSDVESTENIYQSCAPGSPPMPISNGSIKSGQIPAWRIEMRSRMFRTTVHVIAAYLICWLPYNTLALANVFFSVDLQILVAMHLELLRVCVPLNTLLNPFIYGFRSVMTTNHSRDSV